VVGQGGDVLAGGHDAGVEEGGVELALERPPGVRVADVELGQVEDDRLGLAERAHDRRANPAATAGDERLHRTSTTFPVLGRDPTGSCACSTSSSANSAPTAGWILRLLQSSSSSRVAAATTSGAWRMRRPR